MIARILLSFLAVGFAVLLYPILSLSMYIGFMGCLSPEFCSLLAVPEAMLFAAMSVVAVWKDV